MAATPTTSETTKPSASQFVDTAKQAASQSAAKVNDVAEAAKREAATIQPGAPAAPAVTPTVPTPTTTDAPATSTSAPAAPSTSDAQKTMQSNLTSAASSLAGQADALKAQASELVTRYSGELDTLKRGAVAVKELIDKNAALLPAGVNEKYQQLNALLPELGSLVETVKNYQSADLTTLVPKLQADFAKAQKLYGEIKGMLPAGMSLPAS